MSVRMESGSRTGWLYNYHPITDVSEESDGVEGQGAGRAAMVLLFQDHAGDMFYVHLHYNPYILVLPTEGHERDVELGLMSVFGPQLINQIAPIEKEDLDLVNHLSGRKRVYLKVVFHNVQDLTTARARLDKMVKRNTSMTANGNVWGQFSGSLGDAMAQNFEGDALYNDAGSTRWMDWVQDIREYDVKYHMRVAIDLKVFCGLWYDVTVTDGEATVVRCDDSRYAPAMPRVCAYDIETTKAPLKFPQPEVDQIYMISYMLDGRGYLIVNREIVTEDISPFEYTPKPEYEGVFDTFNEADEAGTLRRFFDEMKKYQPNVYVTYNGDYFDFPFIHARALFHGMNMRNEIGFSQNADGAFLNQQVSHLDCFYWVKRDSYLPQGSQGLKAVTKYKLGYEPIEVDPEEMLPLAQNNPQRMASYSVSDAVSTWYLYQKYVHPFIYSLATIIPMSPDDVLRKGSGGLCESLLMVQAEANNVVFPNKKEIERERFYDGHLIDTETYIGGRVEALRSGVYRSDLPLSFHMNPDTYQSLIDDLDSTLKFTIEVENGVKMEEVTNYAEVKAQIQEKLEQLRDRPIQQENPVIYHLDVGAMYPNVILTNRLQPYAIPKPDICAGCCFNSPTNEFQCKRPMSWKWRGELFTAGRYEFQRIKAQLENESFAATTIEQANLAAVQKKNYGNRKGNVLEGTAYERKDTWKKGGSGNGSGNGYRQESKKQQREAADALLNPNRKGASDDEGGDDSDEEGGLKAYHKLNENTQFNMLKKRIGEYSRKAYGKVHETREIMRTDVVCQRENPFYVDTVRLFRDRRYEYKAALKKWKNKLDSATDPDEIKLCQSRCVQMESLQLAHKCILNSFYGYVMRKGSRWYSIEMAAIVTYCGASLIQLARALVQNIGITLELDTDGIWCCLPCTFPENFSFTTSNPKKSKVGISYPCVMLNKMVSDRYTNHQYQDLISAGVYNTRSECSIYFEVDGPYLAMLLPASREEGKSIKKRYAVFNPDGRLAELKGFELKRRGELMLIKDFQSLVFRRFLDGASLADAYASAAVVANTALDLLESKGEGYDTEEILEKITESSNMTRRLAEYPENQKSLAITTARRIAEFLGPQMVKDKGLACHFIISRMPNGRPVTERAIPMMIFRAEPAIRTHFLRKWTGDTSFGPGVDLKGLLDWDYYTARFSACVQKIITIPAALQSLPNPVPRVQHPDWLLKRIRQQNSRFRQVSLTGMFSKQQQKQIAAAAEEEGGEQQDPDVVHVELQDMEDMLGKKKKKTPNAGTKGKKEDGGDSDWDDDDAASNHSEDDIERMRRELDEEEEAKAQELKQKYFQAKSTTQLDPDFFADGGAQRLLRNMKQSWLHRAKLRKELAAGNVSMEGAMAAASQQGNNHFIDLKSKALSCVWNVLEVRQLPEDPGAVQVIASLEKSIHVFRVLVPRRIVVEVEESVTLSASIGATEIANRVLPRHRSAGKIYEVDIPPGVDGERRINELSITEGVCNLYEQHVTRVNSFLETVGCCATVKTALHLQNTRLRPAAQRDAFATEELESGSTGTYLNGIKDRSAFIFHAAADSRGVLAFINRPSKTALIVVVQPAAAARPTINWAALCDEAAKALHAAEADAAISIDMQVAPDMAAGWRLIYNAITEAAEGTQAPLVAVLQSAQPTMQLIQQHALPSNVPYLRVLGAVEDEKLFSDPFRWARLVGRRLLQRYYASFLWVEERMALSRISGIPVCNIQQDSCIHVLDVLYTRALHRRSHVLWCSSSPSIAYEAVEERPREVVMAGGYTSWCVEFSLSRLDVVSILFSQMIQEGDDPSSHVLCDRGVATHFNILRDLVADLLGQAVSNSTADRLLSNVARWMRDPVSSCYEPRLVEMLSGLAHRALTSVLIRLAKLGGRTVKVDSSSVVVLTPKYALQEAVSFARFVTSSLQDQPMLILLSLQPVRYWSPFLVLDKRDYAGLYVEADKAAAMLEGQPLAPESLQLEQNFTIYNRLPVLVRQRMLDRVGIVLRQLVVMNNEVRAEVVKDTTVTLATKGEAVQSRLMKRLQAYFDEHVQEDVIAEVHELQQSRNLYTDEERESAAIAAGGKNVSLWTSAALALEYTKCLCRAMDLLPTNGAVGKLRNNCLRLCNVSPFSPQAQLEADPLSACRMHAVTCNFCNVLYTVDLCQKAKSPAALTACPECHAPLALVTVESWLVRHVNQLVMTYANQDFVCSKCKEMASTYFCDTCCGPLVGKEKPIHTQLNALKVIAGIQEFSWLREVIEAALISV